MQVLKTNIIRTNVADGNNAYGDDEKEIYIYSNYTAQMKYTL